MRHGSFVKLWFGQSVSLFGTAVTNVALPLVAVGLLQATVFEMGVLRALAFIPYIALSLFVGVWVDRLRRRPVLIAANTIRALVLLIVPLSAVAGQLRIEVLYGVALAVGVASLFFEFAYQAYLPSLIPAGALVDGNSKLAQSESVAWIVGPAAGGFLVQLLSAPVAIIVDAASYVVSAITLILITDREARTVATVRPALRREIAEGLSFVFRQPIIRALAVNSALSNFFGSMALAVYFVYVARELALTPGLIGIVLSAGGPGGLLAAATSRRLAGRVGTGPTLVLGQLLMVGNISLVAATLVVPRAALPVLLVASFAQGLGQQYYNVTLFSMRQAITPAPLRGRTVASVRLLTVGAMPIGALAGGFLGERIGIGATIELALAGAVVALLPVLLSAVPRLRVVPTP